MPFRRSPLSLLLQQLIVRTGRTPLRHLWRLLYRLGARAFVARLTRGERSASGYVKPPGADFVPGLSDVDLLIVVGGDPLAQRAATDRLRKRAIRLRWGRLGRVVPLVDDPQIFGAEELGDLVGRSALTYGLDDLPARLWHRPAGIGETTSADVAHMLIRPGLYGSLAGWEGMRQAERLPPEPVRNQQERYIAGWLELGFWWGRLTRACARPVGSRPADLCVKTVAESLRVWIWLAYGERLASRTEAIERGRRLLPEEADDLGGILGLRRSLDQWGGSPAPLTATLPLLVRLARRVADLTDARAAAADHVEVRLRGGDPTGLIMAPGIWSPPPAVVEKSVTEFLPLLDWRGIASPLAPDDAFVGLSGLEPRVFLGAAAVNAGPYPTLIADGLLVRPGSDFLRTRLRAIECRTTDPMSFALLDGAPTAAFPELRGWSAADVARRAIAEHRPWLHLAPAASAASAAVAGRRLGMLLSAARAAVFSESLGRDPELPLTLADGVRALPEISVVAALAAEHGLEHYLAFVESGTEPPDAVLQELSGALQRLTAYGDGA